MKSVYKYIVAEDERGSKTDRKGKVLAILFTYELPADDSSEGSGTYLL